MSTAESASHAFDRTVPALILKMGPQPLHHGTLGAIRSLGRAGVPVYSSRESRSAPAARSRYVAQAEFGILDPRHTAASLARLQAFQSWVGRTMVIIAVDDCGALFIAENAERLREQFLLPPQKASLPRAVACKANHLEICAEAGAPAPATAIVCSEEDLAPACERVGFPAVVKIAQPWLLPPGVKAAVLAPALADAAVYLAQVRAGSGADIVVQELIPDSVAEDWFYHGYHTAGGEPVVGFTGRKLRSYPPFFGATSYGVSIVNLEVLELAQRMLRKLGYAGIVELEFRFDGRDRKYKFLDFNPRLGAQFQFLRNDAAIDVVRAQHLELTGCPVPTGRQVEGCAFMSDFTDVAAFRAYWRRGMVSPGSWLRQAVEAKEHAWFAFDDLRPFTAACRVSAERLAASTARRARRAPRSRADAMGARPAL